MTVKLCGGPVGAREEQVEILNGKTVTAESGYWAHALNGITVKEYALHNDD